MEKVTVLVIEDNPTWQNRLRRWFERYECQVDVAGSYLEAESRLTQRTYDMVTLDMALSPDEEQSGVAGSSGWELLVNRLATDSPHTNVYVLSASFEGEPQRAFELNQRYGVKDFMPKGRGFDPTHLQAWVTEIREAPKPPGRDTAPSIPTTGGLPAHLYQQLVALLLNCGPFDTDQGVKALFVDGRLNAWRNQLPTAPTPTGRVEALIDLLYDKQNDQGNALLLFLDVLTGRVAPDDNCHARLQALAQRLQPHLS